MELRWLGGPYGVGARASRSLNHLRHLPIDEVKLDRSLTASITEDPRVAAIVRSVIDLSHTLGLTTVAEGVENSATAAMLTGYGCDIAQGRHYSQPPPPPKSSTCSHNSPTQLNVVSGMR